MSFLAKGILSFSTVAAVQDMPITSEATKLIISGVFSLGSVLIVELFKYLKARRIAQKTNQTDVEQPTKTTYHFDKSGEIPPTADGL